MATATSRSKSKRSSKRKSSTRKSSRKRKTSGGARAIWKGTISFGGVSLPVRLYSAASDHTVHFRLLDAKKHEPVKQHMVNPETGDVVEYADAKRAIQVSRKRYVIVDDEELDALEPESSREIAITRFVDPDAITHQWYERPYWLGPDGSSQAYFALVEALRDEGKEGVARWVMRKKDYVGALRVTGDYLVLFTLRHAGEVIPASALEPPGGRDVTKRELDMARQLVETMIGSLDIAAYHDEYRERVLDLVDAKAKGKVVRLPRAKEKESTKSLEAVLKRSIEAGRKRRKSA